jgi:hypothetical protein
VTKSDFIDWKRHPVTEELLGELRQRIEGLKDELVYAEDARTIAIKQGAIMAYSDILDTKPEETHGN